MADYEIDQGPKLDVEVVMTHEVGTRNGPHDSIVRGPVASLLTLYLLVENLRGLDMIQFLVTLAAGCIGRGDVFRCPSTLVLKSGEQKSTAVKVPYNLWRRRGSAIHTPVKPCVLFLLSLKSWHSRRSVRRSDAV